MANSATATVQQGPAGARAAIERLPFSKIREVARFAEGFDDLIALWYGEPDLPTPDFITRAAAEALARGQTFYTPNRGVPELRAEIAAYMTRLHGRDVGMDRITVTPSGMAALNFAQQVLVDPGDNVVATVPVWPNLVETVTMMGGEVRRVPIRFGNDGWTLDVARLVERVDGRTRAIMVNSPSNPTGWMMAREAQTELLAFARSRGIWIIADEVYVRLAYDRPSAPSFAELCEPDDRVLIVNSFSKTWAMTGWRLGWLTAPPALGPVLEGAMEFHSSCAAHFSQIAAITAIRDGEPFVRDMVDRYRRCRDITVDALQRMRRVHVSRPEGAFYAFFRVDGMDDSLAACKRIAQEARVGLAPGAAFGPEGEGWIRLCFAQSEDRLHEAMRRLKPYFD